MDTLFGGCCAFFSLGSLFRANALGSESGVLRTSPGCAPIGCVTLGKSLNFFELPNLGSQPPAVYLTELLLKSKWTRHERVLRKDAVDISKDIWSPSKGGSENRSLSSLFSKESPSRHTAEKWHLGVRPRKPVYVTGFKSRQERAVSLVHHLCSCSPLSPYLTIQCDTWST